MRTTLMVVGPGGVGKSPLDQLFRDEIVRLEPYRLRRGGPKRNKPDPFYAHPRLRRDMQGVLESLGDRPRILASELADEQVLWYGRGRILFFTVRKGWQILVMNSLQSILKGEVYGPVLVAMLSTDDVRNLLGQTRVLLLNPARTSISGMRDWTELKEKTRENAIMRGDVPDDIEDRIRSIDEEAASWAMLLANPMRWASYEATECVSWPFAEYVYSREDSRSVLRSARRFLLGVNPRLATFLKDPKEIDQLPEWEQSHLPSEVSGDDATGEGV